MSKLTVIRGLPGSGKSTYAKKNYSCLVLENDMFLISDGVYKWTRPGLMAGIDLVKDMAGMALAAGADVVVCNTFTQCRFIGPFKKLAAQHGASFEVVKLTGSYGSMHSVPKAVMDDMTRMWQDWPGEKVV